MVGQAAEGLGADDVVGARVDQLQHLGGEQPALAHLVAVPQVALDQAVQLLEGAGSPEAARLLQGGDHVPLAGLNVLHEQGTARLFDPLAAVEFHVGHPIVDLEDDEVGQAGHHRLHPLGEEEFFQVVVAQGGKFYINFPYNAHADLGLSRHGDGGEIGADGVKVGPHLLPAHAFSRLEAVYQPLRPCVNHGIGGPGADLVGPHLVGHIDDDVAVHHGIHRLADKGQGEGEARVFLQPGQVYRHYGDVGHVRLLQSFSQQVDVVGGPAAAAGLGDEQAHLVGVVAPVLHRVDKLANH